MLVVPQLPVLGAGLEGAVHGVSHGVNRPGVDTDGTRQAGGTAHKLWGARAAGDEAAAAAAAAAA